MQARRITVSVGNVTTDGQINIDDRNGKFINILDSLDSEVYYTQFAKLLGEKLQSAVIGSFDEQKRKWREPPYRAREDSNVEGFAM